MNTFKRYFHIIYLISLIFLFYSCDSPSNSNNNLTLAQQLQNALDNGINKYLGKGISAAVILPTGETWAGVGGISRGTDPVTTDMLFSAGSITKMFTAVTILQLAESGILSLDDSLHQWLPPYNNIDTTIQIRQLLNHTCGIYDISEHPNIYANIFAEPGKIWNMEDAVSTYTLEPYFPKGTDWHYSNTGYLLLRMIILKATNSSIDSEYRSRFFVPLNLNEMFVAPMETMNQPIAQPWLDLDNNGTYDEIPFMTSFYSMAGGGVFCTARNLAKWAEEFFIERSIFSQNSFDQMVNFQPTGTVEPMLNGYGLGVERFSPELFNNETIWGHGGDALGYAAACFYLPDYGICVAIMDNTENGETMWVVNDIIDIAIKHLNE